MATEENRAPQSRLGPVFVSYASEDAAAAERIASALRDGGIEVWFDKSELRGGDAWDRQIRVQIHECRLFMPIVSAHTEARVEGYFRREWRLAVDRTHDLSERVAFLLPVVIDSTSELKADVPDAFRHIQWTQLPGGETSPAFVNRVRRLVAPDPSSTPATATRLTASDPAQISTTSIATRQGYKPGLWVMGAVVAMIIAYFVVDKFWLPKRPASSAASTSVAGGPASPAVPQKSIAVLPFVDMSEKHDQEYFSDGLSEELIDLLTKIPDLRVPARTSSFFFKGKPEDIATIAQKLRVAHVLEGSVRKAANTIRVTAQLVRADNGYHVWSETYDRDLKDIFQVQDEIAGAVVSALEVKLASGRQLTNSHRTSNPEAHDQYLRGNQFSERGNPDFWRAAEAYRRAIELDSHYAAAYLGLAWAQFWLADETGQALATAEKAIALAPDAAEGYAVRGYLRLKVNWDWTGARADVEKGLAIDSGDAWLQATYALLLRTLGWLPEAIEAQKRATQLDPLSVGGWATLGGFLADNRQFAAAHEALRRALEIHPDSIWALSSLGQLQLLEGKPVEALATFQQENDEGLRLQGIAMAEHTSGQAKRSQQALEELIAKHADWAYNIAAVYTWRGEKDKAVEWLERSYQQHESELVYIKDDPLLHSLYGDPRYNALLRKMNLPRQ